MAPLALQIKLRTAKILIFGTGQIAEEVTNYFNNDSDYKVEGFTIDDRFYKKIMIRI